MINAESARRMATWYASGGHLVVEVRSSVSVARA
jgi:hypothetical protein